MTAKPTMGLPAAPDVVEEALGAVARRRVRRHRRRAERRQRALRQQHDDDERRAAGPPGDRRELRRGRRRGSRSGVASASGPRRRRRARRRGGSGRRGLGAGRRRFAARADAVDADLRDAARDDRPRRVRRACSRTSAGVRAAARAEGRVLAGFAIHEHAHDLPRLVGGRTSPSRPADGCLRARRPHRRRHGVVVGGIGHARLRRRLARAPRRAAPAPAWRGRGRRFDLEPGRYEVILPPDAVADLVLELDFAASGREAEDGGTVYSAGVGSHPGSASD